MATLSVPALRRHLSADGVAGAMASAAGWISGRVLASLPLLPGLAGAAAFSVAAGEVTGHVFGHGLAPWVALGVGGAFALLLDRRI